MISIDTLTELLGWCSIINIGILLFAMLMTTLLRESISAIHGKLFGLDNADIARAYFQYLAQYKIAILIFNLVPYFTLKIMT